MSNKILLLDSGIFIDYYRNSFLIELSRYGDVYFFRELAIEDPVATLSQLFSKFEFNMILSINAFGLTDEIIEYANKKAIKISTWFWDSPQLIDSKKIEVAERTFCYVACSNFSLFLKCKSKWLPFSSTKPKTDFEIVNGSGDIGFLGTLWHSQRVLTAASLGLKNYKGEIYNNTELLDLAIYSSLKGDEKWLTSSNEVVLHRDLINAIAAIDRVEKLSWINRDKLNIYGGYEWKFHLWNINPNLIKCYSYLLVNSHNEMEAFFKMHKISLNLFHIQNKVGGPNFRILESALFSSPILSEWNEGCEKIFPNNIAALYFKNGSEAYGFAEELIKNLELRKKLAKGARDILIETQLHCHRINEIIDNSGFKIANTKNNYEIIQIYDASKVSKYERSIYTEENFWNIENYWYSLPTSTQNENILLKEKIANLEIIKNNKQLYGLRKLLKLPKVYLNKLLSIDK